MDNDDERKALLGSAPSAPYSNNDQLPTYQESVSGGGGAAASHHHNQVGGPGFDQMGFSASPPPVTVQFQPVGYQAMPYIQTQVILVGGCPTCRFVHCTFV